VNDQLSMAKNAMARLFDVPTNLKNCIGEMKKIQFTVSRVIPTIS